MSGADEDLFAGIRQEFPPVLTTEQVCELLHVGARTVVSLASDGRLKASRIPGTRRYNFFRDDVIRVLAEHMVAPGEVEIEAEEEPAKPRQRSAAGRGGRKKR